MKIGYNFSNQWLKEPFNCTIENVLSLLSQTSIDCIEVQLAVVEIINKRGRINDKKKKIFFRLLDKYDVKVGSVHAPYPYFSFAYLNFLKGEPRKEALDSLKNSIRVANELGAKVVVVHPSHTFGFHKDDAKYEESITKKIIGNLRVIRDYVEDNKLDLSMGIETMSPKKNRVVVGDHPKEIVKIVDELDSKRFGVTWDMCHTYKSIKRYNLKVDDLKEISKRTCHIHYSSFLPILSKCHCPTSYGRKKLIHKMIALLNNYNGIVINEISPVMLIFLNSNLSKKAWLQKIIEDTKEDFEKWMH